MILNKVLQATNPVTYQMPDAKLNWSFPLKHSHKQYCTASSWKNYYTKLLNTV